MQLITDGYKKLNEQLHAEKRFYGAIGFRHLFSVLDLARKYNTQDILDYGCGKSSLARNLPFDIKEYDPAVEKFKALPLPADIVVCTDVLEHIEPELLDNVLSHLKSLTKKAGLFSVSTAPAYKTLPDGRNAHLIVESYMWWLNKLDNYFDVAKFEKEQFEVLLIVTPK